MSIEELKPIVLPTTSTSPDNIESENHSSKIEEDSEVSNGDDGIFEEEDESVGEEEIIQKLPEAKKEKKKPGTFRKLWNFMKWSANTSWVWGDWFGEKIAWTIGITESRFQDHIEDAEELRILGIAKKDVENGGIAGIEKNQPDVNKFPNENLFNFLYKKGIDPEKQDEILDLSKPIKFNIDDVVQKEEIVIVEEVVVEGNELNNIREEEIIMEDPLEVLHNDFVPLLDGE